MSLSKPSTPTVSGLAQAQRNAQDGVSLVQTGEGALTEVSDTRAASGSVQNRLEHRIANLASYQENLISAESRIRDVDMAKEMVEFTKSQILQQAGTSMLAQANQSPQGVLSLLR